MLKIFSKWRKRFSARQDIHNYIMKNNMMYTRNHVAICIQMWDRYEILPHETLPYIADKYDIEFSDDDIYNITSKVWNQIYLNVTLHDPDKKRGE